MKKYLKLKHKAIELRDLGWSLNEITEELSVPKGTIYSWIKEIKIEKKKSVPNVEKMNAGRRNKLLAQYDEAYQNGLIEFEKNRNNVLFRDFIVVFLTEGYRKSKSSVEITNTNHKMILMCNNIFRLYSDNVRYKVIYHDDRNLNMILDFWSELLGIEKSDIRTHTKRSNLSGRSEACDNGIMHIMVHDFKLRHMMRAWVDKIEEEWECS